jgi:hypothetical protein
MSETILDCVRFEVFTMVTMKNAIFWDVGPLEDGSDTFLRNVGSHKIYKMPHPRKRHSSIVDWMASDICKV